MYFRLLFALIIVLCLAGVASAQNTAQPVITGYLTTSGCPSTALTPCFVQYGSGGSGPGSAVNLTQVGGANISLGQQTSANSIPVVLSTHTIVTLDAKTVTTGGTAVTAIAVGHRTAGGFIQNPVGATINLCINEIGTATGTTSSGDTTCIVPGQTYGVTPAATGVSVISSDSSHPFSGYGLQ